MQKNVEGFFGIRITDEALRSSIETYNYMRDLLTQVNEWRKREIPPLSGAEFLGLTTAATVMPKDEFVLELKTILPFLEKRKTNLKHFHPRILITSEMLDNPAYLSLVEEGCLVAMDDMDTGSRYFLRSVEADLEDPAYALAKRYISRPGAPRMGAAWDRQLEQIMAWIKEFRIDGVLGLSHAWCYPQSFRSPYIREGLEKAGIPMISLDREYHLANEGQLRTRIGAFLEILKSKFDDQTGASLGGE
jgi:benzoyl-CoA reductase/2-hydroxyglutaryl-CoA dehydratase subunit BcrC/BadD/HgdB